MATAESTQSRLMRERARALAILLLTRQEGAVIQDLEGETGINLLTTLPPGGKPGLRQLGVTLRYVLNAVTAEHANKVLRPFWPVPEHGPYPFPVILFFFTMQNDGAWYSWVAEPVVTVDGKAQLPLRTEPDCQPLTDQSLDQIFDRVDSWYNTHYNGLTGVISGKKRVKKS